MRQQESGTANQSIPPRHEAKTTTNQIHYIFSTLGLLFTINLVHGALKNTPINILMLAGLVGSVGGILHCLLAYHTNKVKRLCFWWMWLQSTYLIALAFSGGGNG